MPVQIAIRILEEMGVMKELKDNNEAHFADSGGTPISFILVNLHIRSFVSLSH